MTGVGNSAFTLPTSQGAVDRVGSVIMLANLKRAGVGWTFSHFLSSYLSPRDASVIVQGHRSEAFAIMDQIFQSTVLGPPFWNVFFADVDEAICVDGFSSEKFADDLTASREFDHVCPNDHILSELSLCQSRVHMWGRRNRVAFDPLKEHFKIIDRFENHGASFRWLGVSIDTKLIIEYERRRIVEQRAWDSSPPIEEVRTTVSTVCPTSTPRMSCVHSKVSVAAFPMLRKRIY